MKPLKKLKSGFFKRNLGLAKIALTSGKNFIQSDKTDLKNVLSQTFKSQIENLVDDLGMMKGSVMKAGQLLSMHASAFLPKEASELLKQLENQSYYLEWDNIKKEIPTHLLELIEIEENPVAAASLGQVHKGIFKETKEVVAVKIQYKGVDKAIDNDIIALKFFLKSAKLLPKGPNFDGIFEEIKSMLILETDYLKEQKALVDYTELIKDNPYIYLPKTYGDLSTKKILITEFINGHNLRSDTVCSLSQEKRNLLGEVLLENFFHEVFEWGLSQTDAHFGNYLIQEEPLRWIFLDFGAHKVIPKDFQRLYKNLILSCASLNKELYFKTIKELELFDLSRDDYYDLLWDYCHILSKPFQNPIYNWGESDIPDQAMSIIPRLIKEIPLKKPPAEGLFIDRKIAGVFYILKEIKAEFNAQKILHKYIN